MEHQKLHPFNRDYTLVEWRHAHLILKRVAIHEAGERIKLDYADIITVQNNLKLFSAFIELAFERKNIEGFKAFGARAIMEHLRWYTNESDNSRMYKITNDITPRFSELSMEIFPELDGFFRKNSK